MSLSMYDFSVPVFNRVLTSLSGLLAKASSHAQAKSFDPQILVDARLYPDMFPLSRQVQIACDFCKGATARLAGAEVPSFPDEERTVAELEARIRRTLDFINGFTSAQLEGSEHREITIALRGEKLTMMGLPYLTVFVLPNVFFHVTTAYNILRHNGVEIGKRDFVGATG